MDNDIDLAVRSDKEVIAKGPSSFSSLASVPSPKSSRIPGSICNEQVSVLIDNDNTHNFLHHRMTE